MWKRLPVVARLAIIVAGLMMPFVVLPAVIAASVVYNVQQRNIARLQSGGDDSVRETRAMRRQREERELRAAREAAVEYSRAEGFDVTKMPVDMIADMSSLHKGNRGVSMYFECAGIRDLVRGVGVGDDVTYSFLTKDREAVARVQEKLRYYRGAATVKADPDREGTFLVEASNAKAINDLAKVAFPKRTLPVEDSIVTTRQWVMPGCKSYDEAVEKLRSIRLYNPDYEPDYTKVESVRNAGGRDFVSSSGTLMSDGCPLPVGSFVVSEVESSSGKVDVQVPGNLPDEEARIDFARTNADFSSVDFKRKTVQHDGTPKDVRRTVYDDMGYQITLHKAKEVEASTNRAYMVFSSEEALMSVLNGPDGVLPKGTFVSYGAPPAPAAAGGRSPYVLEFDVDSQMLSKLELQGAASPALAARVKEAGYTKEDLDASVMFAEVYRDGHASLRTVKEVGLDRARVNGVPVMELVDRMGRTDYGKLDEEDLKNWLDDASRIRAVNVKVDAASKEICVTTVTGTSVETTRKPLDDRQFAALAARGAFSKTEMKDLVMAMHPERFKTYAVGDKSLFAAALDDFIAGRKPRTNKEIVEQMKTRKQARRKGVEPPVL